MDVFCCDCKTKCFETSEEDHGHIGQSTLCEECHDADLARHLKGRENV